MPRTQIQIDIAVIMPAYNESLAIADTIKDYQDAFPEATVVVIDNNSSDETSSIARSHLRKEKDLLLFEGRQGKGNAVRKGVSAVNSRVYIFTDADMTYPAQDARRLYEAFQHKQSDMIIGDRLSSGGYDAHNKRPGHGIGNKMLSLIISWLSGRRYKDVLSGLRIISRPFIDKCDFKGEGFQIETELNVLAAYLRANVEEYPITYGERPEGSASKLDTIRDGIKIIVFALLKWVSFAPLQPLSILAITALLAASFFGYIVLSDFVASGLTIVNHPSSAVAAAALALFGFQCLFAGIILDTIGGNQRRRDVADFLASKREIM